MQLHLALVGLFMPLLIIVPLSGTAYLLGNKGSVSKSVAFISEKPFTTEAETLRAILKEKNIDFDFEYVKNKGDYVVLRPSTRDHYEVHKNESGTMDFKLVEPNMMKILQELHFGHGPKLLKNLQILFGISFFLVILSGLFLTFTLKGMGSLFFLTGGIGSLLLILGLVL